MKQQIDIEVYKQHKEQMETTEQRRSSPHHGYSEVKVHPRGKSTYLENNRPRPDFGTWQPSTKDITRHAELSSNRHDNIMF